MSWADAPEGWRARRAASNITQHHMRSYSGCHVAFKTPDSLCPILGLYVLKNGEPADDETVMLSAEHLTLLRPLVVKYPGDHGSLST